MIPISAYSKTIDWIGDLRNRYATEWLIYKTSHIGDSYEWKGYITRESLSSLGLEKDLVKIECRH